MPLGPRMRSCIYICIVSCQVLLIYHTNVDRIQSKSKSNMMDDAPNQMLKKTDKFRSQFTMDNINNSIGQTMCKPVTKFGYLKTHKCGSTTIQNILLRYVVKHGLNVVLPENGPFVDLSPDPKLWRRPILRPGQNYSVFCLHTMWDHDHVKELIGDQGRGAKYFSIVRDPVDVFISKWDYYGFSKAFKMDLETFATNKSISFREKKKNKKEVKLGMMLDDFFGLPEGNLYNKSAVVAKIAQIDADFDLIMVMERFDESLVLLRELLCWDWGDMTYFKKNSWQDTRRSALSQEGRARLKEWLWGDYLLYDHFKKRFDETIRKYNDNMEWDLEKLRTLNLNIESQCVKGVAKNSELTGIYKMWGKHTVGFKVDEYNKNCVNHAIDAVSFIDYVRERQNS